MCVVDVGMALSRTLWPQSLAGRQRLLPRGKAQRERERHSCLACVGMWTVCAENGPHASPSPDIYRLKTAPPYKDGPC